MALYNFAFLALFLVCNVLKSRSFRHVPSIRLIQPMTTRVEDPQARSSKSLSSGNLYASILPDDDESKNHSPAWSPDDLETFISREPSNSKRDINAKFFRVAAAVTTSVGLVYVLASIFSINSLGVSFAVDTPDMVNLFDPKQFNPVCPSSDGVYSVLKNGANFVVGPENVVQYGPLIASVLLRIRLELCVLESFVYEAIVPFVQKKGLSWVLPLHETVETFVAGTIFAAASNFILLGSTKILTVLFVYFDALTGFPARNIGRLIEKASPVSSAGKNVGKGLLTIGEIVGFIRKFLEAADTFVGRYLVIATTAYIAFKFAHFKLFNDLF